MGFGFGIVIGMTFVSGMICAGIDDWKVWLLFINVSGFVTGIVARYFGVA